MHFSCYSCLICNAHEQQKVLMGQSDPTKQDTTLKSPQSPAQSLEAIYLNTHYVVSAPRGLPTKMLKTNDVVL